MDPSPPGAGAGAGLGAGADGRLRCAWCLSDSVYVAYHDDEWGRPVHDERRLFEKLCLEGFQSGLSWLTILRKRPAFRDRFVGFEPEHLSRFGADDVQRLLGDAAIIRHRGKIEATIANARALVAMHERGETLDALVWEHAPPPGPAPRGMDGVPASTPGSAALATALRHRGFRFVGPTTVYAFWQAMGMVNDHLAGCVVGDGIRAARATPR